ncbi:MAG TPA: hypothetical protein VK945_05780 [Planococcus sp. (in: firmicutes)]|nr:hypothetical protein [Planococcus sp. (in: firmicutes)]
MKRKLMSSLIIVALIFIGLLGYEYLGTADSKDGIWGMSKSYETLEDIKAEADLVVRVQVPLHYDIRESRGSGGTIKQAFYEVSIDEVFIDHTGQGFDEESEIVVNQVIGMKDREAAEYTAEQGMKPMKTGEYLLFLNKVTHPADGIVYYVSNSSQHLYRCRGNETFKNVASDELAEIKYSDLTDGG